MAWVALAALTTITTVPAAAAGPEQTATWSGLRAPLATPWTAQVSPDNALPD
jgi:hypothetical protein